MGAAVHIVQQEHRAHLGREARERALQHHPQLHVGGHLPHGRRPGPELGMELGVTVRVAPHPFGGQVPGDAEHPAVERPPPAVLVSLLRHLDECVVGEVGGLVRLARHPIEETEHPLTQLLVEDLPRRRNPIPDILGEPVFLKLEGIDCGLHA